MKSTAFARKSKNIHHVDFSDGTFIRVWIQTYLELSYNIFSNHSPNKLKVVSVNMTKIQCYEFQTLVLKCKIHNNIIHKLSYYHHTHDSGYFSLQYIMWCFRCFYNNYENKCSSLDISGLISFTIICVKSAIRLT